MRSPLILVANHPSIFDILFFISIFPTCSCIAKKSLRTFSPYSLIVKWAKYITISKESRILEQAQLELKSGRPIIIFPEGTRSSKVNSQKKEPTFKFLRGASNLQILSRARIIPVTITCTPPALAKDHKWYEIPNGVCIAQLKLHPDFTFRELDYSIYRGILSRKMTAELEDFYKTQLSAN